MLSAHRWGFIHSHIKTETPPLGWFRAMGIPGSAGLIKRF